MKFKPHEGMPPLDKTEPVLSFYELWPRWVFYPPVVFYALWLSIKFGGITTLALANPKMKAGGFVGDTKEEIYDLFPEDLQKYLPETLVLPVGCHVSEALKRLKSSNISYPFIAKPNNGCRGLGVQKIEDERALSSYFTDFPEDDAVVLQELIDYEAEAGVFYIRHPGEEKGQIFSLTLKYFPYVYGDGESTLKELIDVDPRASMLRHIYLPRHQGRHDLVLEEGEPYRLSFAGAHSKGAIFKNGNIFITPAMTDFFDNLSKKIPEFYFGRFDVRFKDMTSLETGEELKIIELNGAAAEATHIWDSKTPITKAYKTLFRQFHHVYEIGYKNKKRGFEKISFKKLWNFIKEHESRTTSYPETH